MIRAGLVILLLAALVVAASAVMGEPGRATIEWLGWRFDMTAAAALMLVAVGGLVALIFWRVFGWIIQAPRRAAQALADNRRRQGWELVTRGFVAAAAGDGAEARRCALKAADLVEDSPALVRVLAAQAAEAQGDTAAAEAAYAAMLGLPDMRVAGRRGLMQLALARGDDAGARAHAEAAYGLARGARWAWTALLQDRLDHGDWTGALELVKGALERKIVSPVIAERARAALLAASAAALEATGDARARSKALDQAVDAAKLRPGFAPGVALAARLLHADGRPEKAAGLIEQAWREAPHPALWMAYRDLDTHETPRERAVRLRGLAALNPEHRESRLLVIEQALLAGEPRAARDAGSGIDGEAPTARLCALMARAAQATGDLDEARAWIARARVAPQEPDWSDLDPEGAAFAYGASDWARLVATYAESGELIHPRFERRERVMTDLPDLPQGYQVSEPFLRAAEAEAGRAPTPDDPGVDDGRAGEDDDAGLAPLPRAAK